ncbi:Cathepsin K like protein [Argiope bruennichi]|uniref:Cathepsin K like protein n=1 Tax=Argiope bruennichi TaxID=94029 RepID=A0A8T0G492_ARGBR|nr:Cathepsin K like protein [Argiope bruennichi]
MQLIIILGLFAVATSYSLSIKSELDEHWGHFKKAFGKSYKDSEETRRRLIWEERITSISNHNLRADMGFHTYKRGLNKYSDLTHEEYMSTLNGFRVRNGMKKNVTSWFRSINDQVPNQVDWRDDGLVTSVKDQGSCGSCWAFSTTGSLEGQHKKKTGKLVSLSEQNLIDCVTENNGCHGGTMDVAFEFIKKENGIDTEDSYPYEEAQDSCLFKPSGVGATCTGHAAIPTGNEKALKQAVATLGPISVAIDAHHESFHDYKIGIYDEPNCGNELSDLTHAVLVIGYGTEDGADYWLVKNRILP